ncbi:M20 family metallo-hydrolase [Psychrobacillus antarcticus]|uniref:M20 family metallo-hydrolase n=1 Tax=Psychrobacillus antarcticus TaxID=2879115 RepID=UPI0024084A52|nr:M20 family metallo-hydrolase [Psychrobacillus antarcticus]
MSFLFEHQEKGKTLKGKSIAEKLEKIAQIGITSEGGANRISGTLSHEQGREQIKEWMKKLCLQIHYDEIGNLFGIYEGVMQKEAPIIIGSHSDTVPNGGHFDGILGIVLALEMIESFQKSGILFNRDIVIADFIDEEGVYSGDGLTGSRYLKDQLKAKTHPIFSAISCYIEPHIEQGVVLEQANCPIGIVEAIVGTTSLEVCFEGLSGHAGTTPMNLRRDALIVASEWIVEVNSFVKQYDKYAVGTVGFLQVIPGAPNVIPKQVMCMVDLRHIDAYHLEKLSQHITSLAINFADKRGVSVKVKEKFISNPVKMNDDLNKRFIRIIEQKQIPFQLLPSGAAHDALMLAEVIPTTMLFIQSREGISHTPKEMSSLHDILIASDVLSEFVYSIAVDNSKNIEGKRF